MITENLSTLKIHKLTKAQYERELEAGRIDETALYLTPDETIDLSEYATVEQLNGKVPTTRTINGKALSSNITLSAGDVGAAEAEHTHDDRYYTESEIDTKLSGKLSTGGGTVDGDIVAQDFSPKAANTYVNGYPDKEWKQVTSRNFSTCANNAVYGSLVVTRAGTTSTNGITTATVGNNIGAGTANNSTGRIQIYSNTDKYAQLQASSDATSNTTHYLPTVGGTLINSGNISSYAAPLAHKHGSLVAYNDQPRQTSANIASEDTGGLTKFLATSSMTESNPMADGHIIHCHWDHDEGWDGQLFVPCSSSGYMQYRTHNGGTWTDWNTVLDSSNYDDYAVPRTINYDGNINELVTSGFYRVQEQSSVPSGYAYGQLIVSRGGDTVTQIISSYSTGSLSTRSGVVRDTVTWNTGWKELLDSSNYSVYVGSSGSGGSGMSREFDSGIMSRTSYTTSGSASKFYIVSVKHTSTSRVHSFVVDYRTVYNGGTRTYYEGNASTDAIYFYVTISSLKPTFNAGANYTLYHICGYY